MTYRILSLAILFAILGCGCAFAGRGKWWAKEGRPELSQRAAFDLKCPERELAFTPLGREGYPYETVGVSGCERRATYLYDSGSWIMNTDAER